MSTITPHVLAGLSGDSIEIVPEIHDFATDNGFSSSTHSVIKHMNADQATCGYGYSGNPYDAFWRFSPLGHGDLHELGHGLENGRFKSTGFESRSTTNFYSYYSKSRHYRNTGNEPSCQSLPFDSLFNTLSTSRGEADPFAYM